MSTGKTYSTKYLLDSNNNRGSEGQILSTTSTGIDWVDANSVPGTGLWVTSGNNIYNSNSGKVGIGTTSPTEKLDISGTAIVRSTLFTVGNVHGFTSSYGASFFINNSGGTSYFNATGGNVGIGTTSPYTRLSISNGFSTRTGLTLSDHNTASLMLFAGNSSPASVGFDTYGLRFVGNSTVGTDNGSEFMRITSSGNVGIGTTSPGAKLEVLADVAKGVLINRTFTTSSQTLANIRAYYALAITPFRGGTGGLYFTNYDPDVPIIQSVNTSDVAQSLLLNPYGGNVGIGTTDPEKKLEVKSDTTNDGILIDVLSKPEIIFRDRGNSDTIIGTGRHELDGFHIDTYSGNALFIRGSNRNVGIGTTSPSAKLQVAQNMTAGTTAAFTSPHLSLRALNTTDNTGFVGMTFATSDNTNYGWSWGALRTNGGLGDMVLRNHYNSAQGTEKMRIDYSGNVGIGTDSPSDYDVVDNPILAVGSTGVANKSSSISVLSGTSAYGYLLFADGTTGNEAYRGQLRYSHSDDSLGFVSAGSERMRIDSAGTLLLKSGAFPTNQDAPFLYRIGGGSLAIGSATETGSGAHVALYTNSLERMRIASDGTITATNNAGNLVLGNASAGDIYLGGGNTNTSNIIFQTGSSEKMRISSTGNVGIGTTSPTQGKLDILNNGDYDSHTGHGLTINSSASNAFTSIYMGADDSIDAAYIQSAGRNTSFTSKKLLLNPNGGNVGIIEDNPTQTLHVGDGTIDAVIRSVYTDGSYTDIHGFGIFMSRSSSYIKPVTDDSQGLYLGDIATGANWSLVQTNAATNIWKKDANEFMRLTSPGHLGIGTTVPPSKLTVMESTLLTNSGTDAGASYVPSKPILLVTTDGDGTASSSYATNSVFTVGIGGGVTGGVTTEHFRVNLNGNVGIGTDSPNYALDIRQDTGNLLNLYRPNSSAAAASFLDFSFNTADATEAVYARIRSDVEVNTNSAQGGDLSFHTANAGTVGEVMRLTQEGNVGIGTTSPENILHIETSASGGPQIQLESTSGTAGAAFINFDSTSLQLSTQRDMVDGDWYDTSKSWGGINIQGPAGGSFITFHTATASNTSPSERMRIDSSGNVGIGTTSPSSYFSPNLVVKAGANLGGITIRSNATSDDNYLMFADGTSGNERYRGFINYNHSNDSMAIATAAATAMFINSSGKVGIGTASPGEKLHVEGRIRIGTTPEIVSHDNITFVIDQNENSGANFLNVMGGTVERFRIQQNGNVGIGTTSPDYKLEVNGTLGVNRTNGIIFAGSGGAGMGNKITANTGNDLIFSTSLPSAPYTVSEKMRIANNGATTFTSTVTATNFILSSDERLKENVEKVCDNRVKADWKTFELKTEKGQKRYGVIAQELEKTNPEFVREDSQGFKSVAYIDLLIAKIAELEARLEKLEK